MEPMTSWASDRAPFGARLLLESLQPRIAAVPPTRSLGARAALVLGSTVTSLLLAEGMLRLLGIAPSRYAAPVHLETADKRHGVDLYPDDPRGYFPVDLRADEARAELRAVGLEVDAHYPRTPFAIAATYSEGLCRGPDLGASVERPTPTGPRVVFIGDSFTEGQGVREEDTFVARSRPRFPDAELINCGRRGYDFPRLREWLDLKLALEPQVIVYVMVLNDPHQSEAFHARQAYLDDWILDRRRMVEEGDGAPDPWAPRLVSLLEDRLEGARVAAETERWYREMVGPENAEGWERTLSDVSAMQASAEAHGARFVVLLFPLMQSLDHYPFADVHRTIVTALEARHVTVYDALPSFVGEDAASLWVHPADHHPNERGHALFAASIEETIEAALHPR